MPKKKCPYCGKVYQRGGIYYDLHVQECRKEHENIPQNSYSSTSNRKTENPKERNPIRFNIPFHKLKDIKFLIPLLIIVIIVLLGIFWWYPLWHAKINLNEQLYANKAGGLNYWEFFTLNGWSNRFFFNKTALICAFIGCIVMSLPPINIFQRRTKKSLIKSLAFWWLIGFPIFYVIGNLADSTNQISFGMYILENGYLEDYAGNPILDAFYIIANPGATRYESLFIYTYIWLPFINFTFAMIIVKAAIHLFLGFRKRNPYFTVGFSLIILGLVLGLGYFNAPAFSISGINLIQLWALILGFFGAIVCGVFVLFLGKAYEKNRMNRSIKTSTIFSVIILSGLILTPLFISAGPALNINEASTWNKYAWESKIEREIKWTSAAAGLDMFEQRPIENLSASVKTNDSQIIRLIRQFDIQSSIPRMATKMGSSYEALSDSDIVYFNDSEYWVAPKTLRSSEIGTDAINLHTELYDHVEGLLAIDTSTGDLVKIEDVFNVSDDYPIFFGEHESEYYIQEIQGLEEDEEVQYSSTSYDSDILLGTEWAQGIEKNKFTYTGKPDGTLKGLEALYYTLDLGLWGYAWDGEDEKQFLINRNIRNRVESILLPFLKMGTDPYLVFDTERNRMYYAASIYTSIPIQGYAQTPIYRFLGVCLVDVKTGDLNFYQNPKLSTQNDPFGSILQVYMDKYPWKESPDWLFEQLRYPESLFELQLDAFYKYHVNSPSTWKRGDDFHERPEGGDLFYIEMDVGDGIEYVGIDLVEYEGREANILAGMYVVRHGEHFGEAIFYHTRTSEDKLIGPKVARDNYQGEATKEISLIEGARNGNTLLYPIAGTLCYYVPTYSESGGIEKLKLSGFVNAFSAEVGYGADVYEAYNNLEAIQIPPKSFSLSSDTNESSTGNFTLSWTESQYADTYSIYYSNESFTDYTNADLFAAELEERTKEILIQENGTYYFQAVAKNDFGEEVSNIVNVTVGIELPPPLSYEFEMENTGNDVAKFSLTLENYNTNLTADGINTKLNLSIYRSDASWDDVTLNMHPSRLPLENASFTLGSYSGKNFTVVNETIFPGEGIILNGEVDPGTSDLIVRYKWVLYVDDTLLYESPEATIYFEP